MSISRLTADEEGTIQVPAFNLPVSAALSQEARQAQLRALQQTELSLGVFSQVQSEAEFIALAEAYRETLNQKFMIPLSTALAAAFPVEIRSEEIAGVPAEIFIPAETEDNDRVLINLHGGALYCGAVYGGRVESIPVAFLGKTKVISLDYRQGYEHKHPAATDDVVAVYEQLLKRHAASRIGIYGGSAGGRLTGQAVAAIIRRGLPVPGAAGIFGSGGGGTGDSEYFGTIGVATPPPAARPPLEILPAGMRSREFGYFAGVRADDPIAAPLYAAPEFLAKFPPTLFVTATRAYDLSPAILFHRALLRAGAAAELHVFEGLGHCFYYNAWLPESRDAYDTIVRFFRRHLLA